MGKLEMFRNDIPTPDPDANVPMDANNDNFKETKLTELRQLHVGIMKLIPNMDVKSESLARLVERFNALAEEVKAGLGTDSELAKDIEMYEAEIDTAVQDEFGEGGLTTNVDRT